MSYADKLREIADKVDELETLKHQVEELKQVNNELVGENDYLRYLLQQLGVDDFEGDSPINKLSVADVMAIEKALTNIWAVR